MGNSPEGASRRFALRHFASFVAASPASQAVRTRASRARAARVVSRDMMATSACVAAQTRPHALPMQESCTLLERFDPEGLPGGGVACPGASGRQRGCEWPGWRRMSPPRSLDFAAARPEAR